MPTPTDSRDPANERVALLAATLSSFLTPFMGASANVALPSIAGDLALDALGLGWVSISFLLAAAVALVPFGQLADLHGRKRVFTAGIAVYGLGSFLSAAAATAAMLVTARTVQGIGGAMIFGTSVAILTSVFPPGRRGWVLGVNAASVYAGLSIGPVAGGLITEFLGWRALFVLNGAMAAGLLVIVWRALKGEWTGDAGGRFDLPGSLLYAAALGALMYGLSQAASAAGTAWIVAGSTLFLVFVRFERDAPSPVLDVRFFMSNRVYALSNVAALINYSATFAVGFLLSLYLQHVRALGPRAAGLILVAQPVLMALVSPFAGRWSDRVSPRVVASAGMALTAIGLGLLVPVTEATPLPYVAACLALLGVGFGLFSSPNTNAVMGAVEPRRYGVAASTLGTMRLGGQMLSMGLAVLVLAFTMGPAAIAAEHPAGLVLATRLTMGVFAALCAIGTLASAARGDAVPGGATPRS